MFRRDEEIVFQEKAREEKPMPLIVGKLLDKVFDLVSPSLSLALTIA